MTGLEALDRRLAAYERYVIKAMSDVLLAEAQALQRDIVARIGVHTGTVRGLLASGDAIEITRNSDGDVTKFRFGFLTKAAQKKGFYYLWVETGREAGTKAGRRRAGRNRDGSVKYRKITRTIGTITPRANFMVAFEQMRQRLQISRAITRTTGALQATFDD